MLGLYGVLSLGTAVLWLWITDGSLSFQETLTPDVLAIMSAENRAELEAIDEHISAVATYSLFWGVCAPFAILAAVGMVRFRAWGWWCAVIYVAMYAALTILHVIGVIPIPAPWILLVLGLIVHIVLFVWPLATRRQLFFPPKPEGEG